MSALSKYRSYIDQKKGVRKRCIEEIQSLRNRKADAKTNLDEIMEAQRIIQLVAKETQDEIVFHITEIGTLALNSIFDSNYEFVLNFIEKNNKTCAEILFKHGNKLRRPINSSGFGAINIASFALRSALWNLNRTRNVIIVDEPFRDLKGGNYPSKAGKLVSLLSKKMNLQIILVSHTKEIIDYADRVFIVDKVNGISKVKVGL